MNAQMCTLYIVRHGITDWNSAGKAQGHTDIPLNAKGERQAHALREKLKNVTFSKVYSSDLIRAKRTAEILNLERKLVHQTTNAMRERAFGAYEGQSYEVMKKEIYDLLDTLSGHPLIKEKRVETNESVLRRIITFLQEISVAHEGETILVVSHGGVMRILLKQLGKVVAPGGVDNLAYIKLECDGVSFVVKETSGIKLLERT